ncbi:Thiosulfate sulfurtransferase [Leptospira biflexa serovar Patoc strain 'Patoc 1 (Ames)']|uniref:Putative thiosulfate sulfurtransferase putative signal peptide n=1 Tax=Leptospira biflexa serovar Patoc (strain Patoc 1 / ATCC 23582 / Paris) TaxID=456481 RepID=B0SM16_LEPBP|nr:rhodanese-like domain-containing protein [Leptospira biflexa]ABZ94972.1 Thiosulfate sulfurtransferase [Leptospira biflexa serovar Patoc strain 'Patoc 1 (Ames)']ABZ98646.1 Putative thiosulfate sulfurtransferase; putative signal peptide [Leptospira biflexa serovar Patoc strain 'Patoc 1 (Paris)']
MKIQRSYGIYLFAIALFWALWLQLSAGPKKQGLNPKTHTWFLSPKEALDLPEFKTIDTRSFPSRLLEKLPMSQVLGWEDLSLKENPFRGKLQKEEDIQKKLLSLGFHLEDLILVLGDGASGWGEEGRIVWSLREVGFSNVFWFDGNVRSLKEVLVVRKQRASHPIEKDTIQIKTNITKEEISKQLQNNFYQILDTRETREFSGSTPYGESRGGHIPGAKSFYYQNLFDAKGSIKSKQEVETILSQLGITKTKPIIAYCTGGVRSAFVVGILRSYGYNAYNYSGSMWEWSFYPDLPMEK